MTDPAADGEKQKPGDIRSFGQMADAAHGVPRRRAADGCGQPGPHHGRELNPRTLARAMAMSWRLDLFFSGWLNVICDQVQRQADPDNACGQSLYVIYAGGDDLFIVGAWDLMPLLAKRIHADFTVVHRRQPERDHFRRG